MKKIFLDVGAHHGQSLAAALEKDFDRIHCFEPVSSNWPILLKMADKRTSIHKFGLWNKDTKATLFDPGTKGAGMWVKDKRRTDTAITQEVCEFRRASDWFRENIKSTHRVYLKMNCEGCECDILDDLLDSGEFDKVAHLMVDFDVRKISGMKHREAETRDRLAAYPSPRVMYCRDVMSGPTHKARILNWLRLLPT